MKGKEKIDRSPNINPCLPNFLYMATNCNFNIHKLQVFVKSITLIFHQIKTKKNKRKTISSRFKDVFVVSTIDQCDSLNNEDSYRKNLFYPIVEAVLTE